MDTKSSDLSARLLATENLSVQRAAARTASFDVKSRVLTIPLWKDMTPEIEDMLIGHEVGHALYTTDEFFEPIKETPKLMTYFNVLEDVRIEKLIKRKYPGLRKRMNTGYKQLNDRDFFGVKQVQDFSTLLLIDKINLYFKAGFTCGVEFNSDEKPFVISAERSETIDEVIKLAHEIWAYSKEQLEQQKKQNQQSALDDSDDSQELQDGEFDDSDIDYEDFEDEDTDAQTQLNPKKQKSVSSKEKSKEQSDSDINDQDLESKTENAFSSKLNDLADTSTEYIYHEFDTNYVTDPVIGYARILNETNSGDAVSYEKFKNETVNAVNYMVKEFEMHKSAMLYKRAQVSKSGSLDMKRIWSFKLQDDLFKRITVLPQGKNHGMIFLLDWSGSMSNVIQDTLKQVINLAMFCTRIQIPYRVLAFTSSYGVLTEAEYDKISRLTKIKTLANSNKNILDNTGTGCNFNLLELFSSKMSTSEFHSMANRVIHYNFMRNSRYGLGGTPLNEALVWMYLNIDKYIKQNSIEKMTLITLTDGEGNSLISSTGHFNDAVTKYDKYGVSKRVKQKHFIRDNKTQKTYQLTKNSNSQTETYLRMIKDRYNIMIIGFYICKNARRDLSNALISNLPTFGGCRETQINTWRDEFRKQGFASVKNTGRDDLFLIPQTSTVIIDGELDISSTASAKSIARDFTKFLNVKKTSRILLNKFIGYVA